MLLQTIGSSATTACAALFTAVFVAALVWSEVAASPSLRWLKVVAATAFIAVALSVGVLSDPHERIVLVARARWRYRSLHTLWSIR